MDSLGVYISVPFCKAKCSFCNFASDAFSLARMDGYVTRLCREIEEVHERTAAMEAMLPERVDTIYLGGGTPSLLDAEMVRRIFQALRRSFQVDAKAEITLECAPGQLADTTLGELMQQGMNRVSLGVQSFIDAEATAVGRLHTRAGCLKEIERLREEGVSSINVDLIAGLPLQTEASWRSSVEEAAASGVPHVSVYMLEIDGESRLGRESLASGTRYNAASLPSDEAVADWYLQACHDLESAGICQYEISNFGREGFASPHNLKYWRRDPYVGFGLDAHSMLRRSEGAVRFQNTDHLPGYLSDGELVQATNRLEPVRVCGAEAFEEALFLGLRLNEGIRLDALQAEFGPELVCGALAVFVDLQAAGLVSLDEERVRLTGRGRLLSNEVFERVLVTA